MAARRRRAGALRYCHLDDWTCPTSLYLVEKGNRPNLWLIARPALIASQENAETVTVTIPEADGEELVYEQVVLAATRPGSWATTASSSTWRIKWNPRTRCRCCWPTAH